MSSFAAVVALACLLSATPPSAQPAAAPEIGPVHIGPILLTGYAQFDGLFPIGDHDIEHTGTFRVRRARVYAGADLSPKVGFMLSADAVASPIPLDIYLALRPANAVNIRVGQFVAPYSLERLTSTRDLEVIDRTLDSFVPGRDLGVMVFNNRPFRSQLLYSVAVINGTGQNARDTNDAKDVVGRVVWRPPQLKYVSMGVNGQSGRQALGMRTRWGADVSVEKGDTRVAAEYVHEEQQWGAGTGHGFYVLARRRFRPSDKSRTDFAEAVVRFVDVSDPNQILAGVAGLRRREIQTGGNYYLSRNARLMADLVLPVTQVEGVPRATIVARVQFMF